MLQAFGCLINSVIHCIMYSHYFVTSFGFENPFKKFITQAQLIQFAMCIVHALCGCAITGRCARASPRIICLPLIYFGQLS